MNNVRTITIWLTVFTLFVFAITPAYARVSSREAKKFIKEIESEHQLAFRQLKEQFAEQPYVWVQADNKDVECKIFFGGNESDALKSKFYWDGECRDGYAVGLGREFLDATTGLSSWLAEYGAPGSKPSYYYMHNYDAKVIWVGFSDASAELDLGKNGTFYQLYKNISGSDFRTSSSYFDPETGYMFGVESYASNYNVSRYLQISESKRFQILNDSNPTQEVAYAAEYVDAKTNTRFGYAVAKMRNGQVRYFELKNGSPSEAKLPSELVEHFLSLEGGINAKLSLAQSYKQRGELALEVYKRRTCSGELNVDFMDNIMYGQICLEHGDFTPYIDKIEELKVNAQKRQEANAQSAQAQAQINADRWAAAAAQQQAQQAQANQAISNAAQQSANTLNNILNMNSALNSNYSPPTFDFAPIRKGNVSVCHVKSNIVFCN